MNSKKTNFENEEIVIFVKCRNCGIVVEDIESHLKEGCRKRVLGEDGEMESIENENNKKIKKFEENEKNCAKNDFFKSNKYQDKEGKEIVHKEICEKSQNFFEEIEKLNKRISFISNQNNCQDLFNSSQQNKPNLTPTTENESVQSFYLQEENKNLKKENLILKEDLKSFNLRSNKQNEVIISLEKENFKLTEENIVLKRENTITKESLATTMNINKKQNEVINSLKNENFKQENLIFNLKLENEKQKEILSNLQSCLSYLIEEKHKNEMQRIKNLYNYTTGIFPPNSNKI